MDMPQEFENPFQAPEVQPKFGRPKSALEVQAGGDHYKELPIQPVQYIFANNIPYLEGNVIKYVTRHRAKNGKQDLEKAIHYLQLLIELDYPETGNAP